MKFDFSYIKEIYDIINRKENIEILYSHKAFKDIMKHAKVNDNDYVLINELKNLEKSNYIKYLLNKCKDIFNLINYFNRNKDDIIKTIESNVRNTYKKADFQAITIYFAFGYDIGIAINNDVVSGIEFNHVLKDPRELVSILIHEVTHLITSSYFIDSEKYNLLYEDAAKVLNYLIQYEGIAIFTALNYRKNNNMKNTGFITNTDYENTKEKEFKLRQVYKECMNLIKGGKDKNFIFNKFFEARVDHSLGFIIFDNAYNKYGNAIISKMAHMENKEFVKEFLYN